MPLAAAIVFVVAVGGGVIASIGYGIKRLMGLRHNSSNNGRYEPITTSDNGLPSYESIWN
jgi:hypothetical protein